MICKSQTRFTPAGHINNNYLKFLYGYYRYREADNFFMAVLSPSFSVCVF